MLPPIPSILWSLYVDGSQVLPRLLYKNQLLQIVVKLKWSMVLGHLPHSQCRVPETITSKHGTKHGTLGPGLVRSTSSVLSYSFSFHFHWARFICSESSTRFPVACGAKTYNKEARGGDKVSHFKHLHARVSSMKLLSHLTFVTTETEPRFENLPHGHINRVNFLSLCIEETLGIAPSTA